MKIKLLVSIATQKSTVNNTFRREYTLYCDLTLANILSYNVWTVNAPIYQVIALN